MYELAKNIIEQFEGYRLDVYLDSAGLPTVGYGHLITPADGLKPGDHITPQQAEALLEADMRTAVTAVDAGVKVALTENQRAALISFVFNVGAGAFRKSTLLRLLNAGNAAGAADQFLKWDRAGGREVAGLKRRRQAERDLFIERLGPE